MSSNSQIQQQTVTKNSILLPIGVVLIVVGLFFPSPIDEVARQMPRHGLVWMFLLISSDLLRLGFFAGVGCTIIGVMRNRKKKSRINDPSQSRLSQDQQEKLADND